MFDLEIKPEADKIFRKLSKKNRKQLEIIHKKILAIRENPFHEYKFLRNPLQNYNGTHIDEHFVLVYRIDNTRKAVIIYYFGHHDEAYKWKPHD